MQHGLWGTRALSGGWGGVVTIMPGCECLKVKKMGPFLGFK